MKNLNTYEEFLMENFREGDEIQHRTFSDISGVVKSAPMKWADLTRKFRGIDMPEEDDPAIRSRMKKPVWIAVLLDDGETFFGVDQQELVKK